MLASRTYVPRSNEPIRCISSNDAGVNTNAEQYDADRTPNISETTRYDAFIRREVASIRLTPEDVKQYDNARSHRRACDIFWNFYLFDCKPGPSGQQRPAGYRRARDMCVHHVLCRKDHVCQFAREAARALYMFRKTKRQTKRQSVEDIVDGIFREFDEIAREANA